MTKYEKHLYERDIPAIRKSLESIVKTLDLIQKKIIISDPGDEVEPIYNPKQVPDDYKMD